MWLNVAVYLQGILRLVYSHAEEVPFLQALLVLSPVSARG
jgi:hypothetical protein